VVADADSITGSIGVIWVSLDVNKLLDDFGVRPIVLKKGAYKDIGSMFREMADDEKQLLQAMIDDSFSQFKGDVYQFRKDKGLQLSKLDEVADGRIISGRQALQLKLVDELSSREAAIKKAAQIGGIKGEPVVKNYENKAISLADVFFTSGQSFAKGFSSSFGNGASASSIRT
jgi:protease-4